MEELKVGMAVKWKENFEYIGIVWHIDDDEKMATVEFLFPTCFTLRMGISEIEPVDDSSNKKVNIEVKDANEAKVFEQQILDRTLLNTEEREELKNLFIDLALLTNDKKWFEELMKGKLL